MVDTDATLSSVDSNDAEIISGELKPLSRPKIFLAWFTKTRTALICLIGALTAILVWGFLHAVLPPPAPSKTPSACPSPTPTVISASAISVTILNGGARAGTGGQVSTQLSSSGFQISNVANTNERVTNTVVRGAATNSPQALLVAAFFGGATIVADGRSDAYSVDVIVGSQFQPMNLSAPQSLTVPGTDTCNKTTPAPTSS